MGLVSGSVSSLINGVSQQPPWLRLPSQGAVQENFMSSLVDGLTPRPPTEHVARISAASLGNAYIHTINRNNIAGAAQRYAVVVKTNSVRVFDLADGSEKTVNAPHGFTYLGGTDKSHFACSTIADFTFISCRTSVPTNDTSLTGGVPNKQYVYIRQALYNCLYSVYIDGVLVGSTTTAATGSAPQTETIAALLGAAIASSLTTWTVNVRGSTISINDGNNFHQVQAYDSAGDSAIVGFSNSIQNFSDLPREFEHNAVIQVTGSQSNAFDSYWVKYDNSVGQWQETVKPTDKMRPNPVNMPHKLTREIDGTFTFDQIDWAYREAGDLDSCPDPSFLGKPINDMVVHRNRLYLLADQFVCASRPGGDNFFAFYPTTATTSLDTDPIDISLSSSTSSVPFALFGVPFAQDLMIFTGPAQYRLGAGDQVLTGATAKASPSSDYATQLTAKPATNGKVIHFAIEKGGDSGIREGFIDGITNVFEAPDITIHVPTYLKGAITKLVSLTNRDTLLVQTAGSLNKLGIYTWYVEGQQKLQSSWSYWAWPSDNTILDVSYIEGVIYFLIERPTGVFLEKLRLDASLTDTGLDYNIRLDRKCHLTGVYNAGTNLTTWTLPYDLTGITPVGAYGATFTGKIGFLMPVLTVVSATAGTVSLPGDHSAGQCHFGVRYTRTYQLTRPSMPAHQTYDGKNTGSLTDGRLQLRHLFFNHERTGHYSVTVAVPGRNLKSYTFTPKTLGQFAIGAAGLDTGRFRVPARARNDQVTVEITSDSHFPCSILSFDWEGEFTLRSHKV